MSRTIVRRKTRVNALARPHLLRDALRAPQDEDEVRSWIALLAVTTMWKGRHASERACEALPDTFAFGYVAASRVAQFFPMKAKRGGARRDRTADLLHAMQALSQLSYGPVPCARPWVTQVGGAAQPRPQIWADLKCISSFLRRRIHRR